MEKITEKQSIIFRTPLGFPVQSVGDSIPYSTLQITVRYRKGQGYLVSVQPVRVTCGILSATYGGGMLVSGFSVKVQEATRFSSKTLKGIADKVEGAVPTIERKYSERLLSDAHKAITELWDCPVGKIEPRPYKHGQTPSKPTRRII